MVLVSLDERAVYLQDDLLAPRGALPPTSVGGTLPMLLLSVLPPVIPRASWPCAEHCVFGHGVTFSSEPKLDEAVASSASLPDDDDESGKLSVFGKLLNILGPRKSSSVSYSAGTGGIAAALKVHMGYIAGLVPTNKSRSGSLDSSSHSNRYCVRRDVDEDSSRMVSRLFKDDSDEENPQSRARSSQSLSHRVSFSIQHQHSQPALKVRGSPRFPHRIVPTCSLDALEERLRSGTFESGFSQRTHHFGQARTLHAPRQLKCRSLEDASSPVEQICITFPRVTPETPKPNASTSS